MINPKDPSDMYSMIANYPAQFAKGLAMAEGIRLSSGIDEIIVAGIGGSALAPDLVYAIFKDEIKVPFSVHRNYDLPKAVSSKTLVIGISFSGNTEETLSTAEAAHREGAQLAVVTSGGRLADFARTNNSLPLVLLTKESKNFQPRMSSGYIIGVITRLLINARVLPETAQEILLTTAEFLNKLNLTDQSKGLAKWLRGPTPLIYASDTYWPVARIAKIKLNENSKVPCFWNVIPEMNHNEMVGFTNPQGVNYRVLMLRDSADHPRINRRMEVLAGVLREKGIKSKIIDMVGDSYAAKTLSTLMLMDWVSYYLALELGIDPTPVDMVEEFKAAMVK